MANIFEGLIQIVTSVIEIVASALFKKRREKREWERAQVADSITSQVNSQANSEKQWL
jgi:hypothetical protein